MGYFGGPKSPPLSDIYRKEDDANLSSKLGDMIWGPVKPSPAPTPDGQKDVGPSAEQEDAIRARATKGIK